MHQHLSQTNQQRIRPNFSSWKLPCHFPEY